MFVCVCARERVLARARACVGVGVTTLICISLSLSLSLCVCVCVCVCDSTAKNALNGQCFGRVTDGNTLVTVEPEPFARPDFLGNACCENCVKCNATRLLGV